MQKLDSGRRHLVESIDSYASTDEILAGFENNVPAITSGVLATMTFVAASTVACGTATGVIVTGAVAASVNIGC